jgi:phosphate transport system permease protein
MQLTVLLVALGALVGFGYWLGRSRSLASARGAIRDLHSLPSYHGAYVALWCGLPALTIALAWLILEPHVVEGLVIAAMPAELRELSADRMSIVVNEVRNLAAGYVAREPEPAVRAAAEQYASLRATGFAAMAVVVLGVAIAGLAVGRRHVRPTLRARNRVERVLSLALMLCSTLAILTTIGIVLSLLFEAIRFFRVVPLGDFLFGLDWSPQIAIRADQAGSSGAFGAVPLIVGTLVITAIAMFVSGPIGLMAAIYTANYAPPKARSAIKPILEILAGIPTVVYGFFAALTVAPLFRGLGESLGLSVSSESALAAGVVMGIMIIPFVSSLSDDVMKAVPQAMRDGSAALGATPSETIVKVIVPAALPGIVGAFLLAISRAIGETMIVVMAAGLAANLTVNPLEAVTTVTVQIVTLLVGDQEFDSPKTLAAFALGLMLFAITLALNVIALGVVRKYREKYD